MSDVKKYIFKNTKIIKEFENNKIKYLSSNGNEKDIDYNDLKLLINELYLIEKISVKRLFEKMSPQKTFPLYSDDLKLKLSEIFDFLQKKNKTIISVNEITQICYMTYASALKFMEELEKLGICKTHYHNEHYNFLINDVKDLPDFIVEIEGGDK